MHLNLQNGRQIKYIKHSSRFVYAHLGFNSNRKDAMKKILVGLIIWCLFVSSAAWGQDAMYFYNLGLHSSLAFRKIHYFTKTLELDPKLSEAYEKRGLLYYDQGKYPQMIQDYRRVVDLKPLEPGTYMMLGLAYMKQKDYDAAIGNLTRAIELDPQLGAAYSYISEAYRLKGMTAEAIENSTKAIELGSASRTIGRAYATRAKSNRSLGNVKKADADFKRALRIAPEYIDYTFFTVTEFLADSAAESSSLKRVGLMGVFMIIGLVFVGIFRLVLPAPKKDNDR